MLLISKALQRKLDGVYECTQANSCLGATKEHHSQDSLDKATKQPSLQDPGDVPANYTGPLRPGWLHTQSLKINNLTDTLDNPLFSEDAGKATGGGFGLRWFRSSDITFFQRCRSHHSSTETRVSTNSDNCAKNHHRDVQDQPAKLNLTSICRGHILNLIHDDWICRPWYLD